MSASAVIIVLLLTTVQMINSDVCTDGSCKCSKMFTEVNCDTRKWTNLTGKDFPVRTKLLSLVNNQLEFSLVSDLDKINTLPHLIDLSLNQNPLRTIPLFNNTNLQSLSLQTASLLSAKFPSTYIGSGLKFISLSGNRISSIDETDFNALHDTKLTSLYIDDAYLTKIDRNAFNSLHSLQSLSLVNNQLASCAFLSTMPLLSSIKLDGNLFITLPQQLASPDKIKVYSFQRNNISIIDESSPLNTWSKMNYTNVKIYLSSNPLDCCLSLWFVRFLKTSSRFIADAPSLRCANPKEYADKKLIELDPDAMNCGGSQPSHSWWTTARIISVTVGVLFCGVVTVILVVVIRAVIRRNRSRSGYTEIDGINEPTPYEPIFPPHGEEEDDQSIYSTAVNTTRSQPVTSDGVSVIDGSHIEGSELNDTVSNQARINV